MNANFPMTLRELADELEAAGMELVVYRANVEYDQRVAVTDVYATLECRAVDRRPEEDQPDDAYQRAMEILG
jgi:hypothetical protein